MQKFTKNLFSGFVLLCFSVASLAQSKTSLVNAQSKIDDKIIALVNRGQLNIDMTRQATIASNQFLNVEITGTGAEVLQKIVLTAGGKVYYSSDNEGKIVAKTPISSLDKIASSRDVKYIKMADTISPPNNTMINKKRNFIKPTSSSVNINTQ